MSQYSTENKIKSLIVHHLNANSKKLCIERLKLKEIPFDLDILSELHSLSLKYNLLSSLPTQLKHFHLISELDISYNQFESIPNPIRYLTPLRFLYCHHNRISKIDNTLFSDLRKLEVLNLNYNEMVDIPESISSCSNLKKLFCSHNRLFELPEGLSRCHNLQEIRSGYNRLSNLPESFGNLRRLETLIIHKNQLEYLPENIADMVSLRVLDVAANNIQVMPSEINDMSLSELYYECNPLLQRNPVSSQQIDEVMPLMELSIRVLAKELQNKKSYQHVKLRHFPVAQELLEDAGECALCGGAYRDIWIECVRFIKRNPKFITTEKCSSDIPIRAAICSQTCFSSKEHEFFGVANL